MTFLLRLVFPNYADKLRKMLLNMLQFPFYLLTWLAKSSSFFMSNNGQIPAKCCRHLVHTPLNACSRRIPFLLEYVYTSSTDI